MKPQTIQTINQAIVAYGQELHGEAGQQVRADSFVIETNIHYPTESSLIHDGIRKTIALCVRLANDLNQSGWQQVEYLLEQFKKTVRKISQIAASKSPKAKATLSAAYEKLLNRASMLLERAKALLITEETAGTVLTACQEIAMQEWINLTKQVCDTANRRVLLGENVPNQDKLFSLFETHTQLYKHGKAGQPIQYGRLALVFEDGAGFISHGASRILVASVQNGGFFEASTPASNGSPKSSLGGATFVETARTIGALSTEISLPRLRPRRA